MGARRKNQVPKGIQPDWWKSPTFSFYRSGNPGATVRVELVLPDGAIVNLGRFPDTGDHNELRQAVGLCFKQIWDPEKFRRRTPTT